MRVSQAGSGTESQPKSLADVLVELEGDVNFDPVRRSEYRGAAKTISAILGSPAD
jgi:hypothetical protein